MANSDCISILKKKIRDEISSDPIIVKAFGDSEYDPDDIDWSGSNVNENYIFDWNKNPETITETITFITIQVNVRKYKESWVKPIIIINIYTHEQHMKLNENEFPGIVSNRNDYLSQLIDQKFNGRTFIGDINAPDKVDLLGELELSQNYEGLTNCDFAYRQLVFETKDLNYSLCSDGR